MSTGRPLQQYPSNVRVVVRRNNHWSKALSSVARNKNGGNNNNIDDDEDREDKEKITVKLPSPILKKVSSFDRIEDDDHRGGDQEQGLGFESPLRKDGLVMDPPTPMFFSFSYGLYPDSTAGSNGMTTVVRDDECSSNCSSSVEDPSPPPWKSAAADDEMSSSNRKPKKKKVTFAVPEAVTFDEREVEAPPPLVVESPRTARGVSSPRSPRSPKSPSRSPSSVQPGLWSTSKKQSSSKAGRVAPEGLIDLAVAAPAGSDRKRCSWITTQSDPAYVEYHDSEWGVPVHDDKKLFELLVFAGAQAELSWSALLSKREHYRAAFAGFDAEVVSKFDEAKIASLAADPEILQHEGKLRQIVDNAKCIVEVVQEFGSLDKFLWNFLSGKPIVNRYRTPQQVPIKSAKSDLMSRDLMKRGFRFVGPTIMYSFMQVAGMTNDHVLHCFRHQECIAIAADQQQQQQQQQQSPIPIIDNKPPSSPPASSAEIAEQ